MLILSGRKGDHFHVGDDVRIEILSLTNGQVKLGFLAPKSVEIDRSSVREAKIRTRYADDDSHNPEGESC